MPLTITSPIAWHPTVADDWGRVETATVRLSDGAYTYGYRIAVNGDRYESLPCETGWRFGSESGARAAALDAAVLKLREIAQGKWEVDCMVAERLLRLVLAESFEK